MLQYFPQRLNFGISPLVWQALIAEYYIMKFLFKTIVFAYNSPIYYRVHQINNNEYHAEPMEENRKAFNFRKHDQTWIAEGNSSQHHAQQLGEKIDRIKSVAD